jgi:hypothetical protein
LIVLLKVGYRWRYPGLMVSNPPSHKRKCPA